MCADTVSIQRILKFPTQQYLPLSLEFQQAMKDALYAYPGVLHQTMVVLLSLRLAQKLGPQVGTS